ncbi:MAG: heavy metal sensor histidine kinase [Syntrophobacteraceae bacterium]
MESKKGIFRAGGWSLATRLTFLVTLSFVSLLCVATLYLYVSMSKNIVQEDTSFLTGEIARLRAIIAEDRKNSGALADEVTEEVHWGASAQRAEMFYARVLDPRGKVVAETQQMERILPPGIFTRPLAIAQRSGREIRWKSEGGGTFLIESAWADAGRGYVIQVGLNISHEEEILLGYRKRMALVLVIGTLFSILMCGFVVRRGTRPLDDIIRTVRRITAEQLHERIGQRAWPKELGALAAAFDGMLDRLEESFGRLSRFSANIAHELRTPVNGLMGAAEVTLSRQRTSEEYRQVIESSLEEYARLSRMIESLLFLARAENREIAIERSRVDVYREMENVRELYDAVAEESGVEVLCRAYPMELSAEPVLFQRAIANLLANALQYTPRGGRIILAAEKLSDESVNISVSDTGCGIPAEQQASVFERFYRGDPSRSVKANGTGLGLAIVRSIMELHGGTATIQSEENKGTIVTLNFPST